MKYPLLFSFVLSLILPFLSPNSSFAQITEPLIKVKLINFLGNQTSITLKPNGDFKTNTTNLILKSGVTYQLKQENGKLSVYKDRTLLYSDSSFSIQPLQKQTAIAINNRLYLGSFDFTIENNQYVRPINTIPIEDYLKGVVPIEMYPFWPIDALKAQAVAARTYAMSYITRGVINDTITYQVYGGYVWTPNTTKAVDETKGLVAEYNGRLINAVYSASNGGKTESNANAWGISAVPYLTIKDDPFDPKSNWCVSFHKKQIDLNGKDLDKYSDWWDTTRETDTAICSAIKTWLKNNGYANKDIKIQSIPVFTFHDPGTGGRVSKGDVTVQFFIKDVVDSSGKLIPQQLSMVNVNPSILRSMIGNRTMPSYLVDEIKPDDSIITIKGRGDGHGVGMSQWGAKNMAVAGKNYQSILSFYYPSSKMVQLYDENRSIQVSNPIKMGWVKKTGRWYFVKPNGAYATGWLKDNNQWYLLNSKGVMLTGWQTVRGKRYYLRSSGIMATGWIQDHGKRFYFNPNGAMATGWIMDKGKWYYLSTNGSMVKN